MVKTPDQIHRELLIDAYKNAGDDFLALRLEALFTKIETEADKVRHNDILADVLLMVERDPVTPMKRVANGIMGLRVSVKGMIKKVLSLRVAKIVLDTAKK